MKDEGQYWLFVDSKSRVVSRRLSQLAAEAFIQNLRSMNLDHWWAWNPSFRDWIPLKNILGTQEGKPQLLISLPMGSDQVLDEESTSLSVQTEASVVPEEYQQVREFLREEDIEDIKDFSGDDFTFSRVPKLPPLGLVGERRRALRVDKRVEVLISYAGRSFRTFTLNISLTGVKLELALPYEFQGGPFEIVFISIDPQGVKKQFAFQGKVSGDLKDRRRLVFGDLNPKSQKILEALFAA